MRHRKTTAKLSRPTASRKALLNSLAAQVILYEAITTTEAKAKAVRRVVEPFITKAKQGTLHQRRLLLAQLPLPTAVSKLFDVLAPRYATRPGGYTRIIKLKNRVGDGAPLVKIELVK
ncbi:MAG: 50S ribosomal protein L17 [Candidatus Komeilibacteria bacterium]|nr:50S ribosomal protein L17 [Candidatus Komeilibacteria bacterium]